MQVISQKNKKFSEALSQDKELSAQLQCDPGQRNPDIIKSAIKRIAEQFQLNLNEQQLAAVTRATLEVSSPSDFDLDFDSFVGGAGSGDNLWQDVLTSIEPPYGQGSDPFKTF